MNRFLASVGTARLLMRIDGRLCHIADARTLTETSLNLSTQTEEIRAGEGAKLYGNFFHSSQLEISLTDVMWDINYVKLMVGEGVYSGALHSVMKTEMFEKVGAQLTLSKKPSMIGNACGLNHTLVWLKERGCVSPSDDNNWICVELDKNTYNVNVPEELRGKDVCIQYFVSVPQARALSINANFLPAEVVLILKTNTYAGSYDDVDSGRPVGSITVKIPRFQLNGTLDLSMAMTSVSSMQLSGVALAVDNGGCSDSAVYAEVVEVEDYSSAATGLISLIVDKETAIAGEIPIIYGLYKDGHISVIPPDEYSANPEIEPETGLVNGTTYTISVGDIEVTFDVGTPSAHFKGNPVIFNSNENGAILRIEGEGSSDEKQIIRTNNIQLNAGDTTVKIIGDSNSEIYDIESERPMVIEAGDTIAVIYG